MKANILLSRSAHGYENKNKEQKTENKNKTFFVWYTHTHSLQRSYIPDDIYSFASVAGKLINISINVLTTSQESEEQESGERGKRP